MLRLRSMRGDIAEAAVTIPIVLLIALGLINLAFAGYAAASAQAAAHYGARMGSVAQSNPAGVAAAAAWERCHQIMIGSCRVSAWGGGQRGAPVVVQVRWQVPNFYRGIAALLGVPAGDFHGTTTVIFRQEGW